MLEGLAEIEAAAAHKMTEHYTTWRNAVADMMATPRTSERYMAAFPVSSEGRKRGGP